MRKILSLCLSAFNRGFSLYEVVLCLTLSTIILGTTSVVGVSLFQQYDAMERSQEDDAMLLSLTRTIEQDVHGSREVMNSFQHLELTLYTGVTILYYVNSNHQMIRYQLNNGGVAVVADRVSEYSASIEGQDVNIHVAFIDGQSATVGAVGGGTLQS